MPTVLRAVTIRTSSNSAKQAPVARGAQNRIQAPRLPTNPRRNSDSIQKTPLLRFGPPPKEQATSEVTFLLGREY